MNELSERQKAAIARAEGARRVLRMVGSQVQIDGPSMVGGINAILAVLIRAELVTAEEFAALSAEGTADFLQELLKAAQATARTHSNVGEGGGPVA